VRAGLGSVARSVPLRSKDAVFFDLLAEAGTNIANAAKMLEGMFEVWPEDKGLARDILKAEQEGDRITQEIVRRLNSSSIKAMDGSDVYALATQLDDIVDDAEEAADFMVLYGIEAPMEQAHELAGILSASSEQIRLALANLQGFEDVEKHLIEVHRLENEGDRVWREALAALFSTGIDPMVVIRWKDVFGVLERAIDSTETAAHTIEAIVVKQSS
jgi:predicted phosphate transport protein (TIGR00153 family)